MNRNESLTRRGLLQRAGALLVSATAPASWTAEVSAVDSGESVMPRLSDYMAQAKGRALPPEIVEATKLHILDTMGAMISGADLAPAKVALEFARRYGGREPAHIVVGSDILCGPLEAAFTNGMLAHSDETDDSHSPSHSHPGCAIVPAALSAGELFRCSGEHLLRSVALGYDIGPRVLMTLGGQQFQEQTHRSAHSIANTFGSSAAAGCCAGLNAQQMRWLLDYAAQQASGIAAWQRDTQHVEKAFVFGGAPARNGVQAAILVQLGATGVDDIFSGADNFLLAFGPAGQGGCSDRSAWRPLRGSAYKYQEMDGRVADSGTS